MESRKREGIKRLHIPTLTSVPHQASIMLKAALLLLAFIMLTVKCDDATTACKEGESVSTSTGKCEKSVTVFVNNLPQDCPFDVGCVPIKPVS